MANMTIRYDDELEPKLEKLMSVTGEKTKNKAIIIAINELPVFINRYQNLFNDYNELEGQFKKLKRLLVQKENFEKEISLMLDGE